MSPLVLRIIALLAAVWLVAGGVIWWARSAKPTPESVLRYIETHSVEGKSAGERDKVLVKTAEQLNRLTAEQRREVRMGRKLDRFFRSLSADEQGRFLDLTLPTGFKQMMDAFNKMEPAKRRRFVERTLNDMREREGEDAPRVDDPHVQKIISHGLKSFYSDAGAETKLDLAPLIEQMQRNLQGR